MTYSSYAYGSNRTGYNRTGYGHNYGSSNAKSNEPSGGGWSKGTSKNSESSQNSGGWGKKTQPQSQFGSGTRANVTKNTLGFGNRESGFGSFRANKINIKQQQHTSVPITTVGLPFESSDIEEKGTTNQKKKYNVCHINMLAMFSAYTTDELRYYDYLKLDNITAAQADSKSEMQQGPNRFSGTGSSVDKNQQRQITRNVDWWQVPYDKKNWPDIIDPAENYKKEKSDIGLFYKQPFLQLRTFNVSVKKVKEREIPTNTRIKLKGFKESDDTFSSYLDSMNFEQNEIIMDSTTNIQPDDYKFKLQFSMTPSTRTSTTTGGLSDRPNSRNPNRSIKSKKTKQTSQYGSISGGQEASKKGLSFIPDICQPDQIQNKISNLCILKDDVKLIFPMEFDWEKLNLTKSVGIESKGNKRTINITPPDNADKGIPTIIIINNQNCNQFTVTTEDNSEPELHDGPFLSLYIPSLNCYPVHIFINQRSENPTDF